MLEIALPGTLSSRRCQTCNPVFGKEYKREIRGESMRVQSRLSEEAR